MASQEIHMHNNLVHVHFNKKKVNDTRQNNITM
jgi:hypothetical protein